MGLFERREVCQRSGSIQGRPDSSSVLEARGRVEWVEFEEIMDFKSMRSVWVLKTWRR